MNGSRGMAGEAGPPEVGLARIREFVNAWDPMVLIERGAPQDEYDPEIRDIRQSLESGHIGSESALAACIAAVFTKWFGDPFTAEMCSEVARGIWGWWQAPRGSDASA